MGTEVTAAGGGSGLFRDVLEGSFPELYAAPEDPAPEEAPDAEVGEGEEEGDAPPAAVEGGKDDEQAEGEEGEEDGAVEPAEEPDEYQRRIADIDKQVRTRTHAHTHAPTLPRLRWPGPASLWGSSS